MRVALLDLSARLEARDWCVLVLPRAHRVDCVALVVDHLVVVNARPGARLLVSMNSPACTRFSNSALTSANVASPIERFSASRQQLALIDYCFTLQIFLCE